MENIPQFLNNEESSWQKASASLDASAKIYGYRVDSVHSEIFKFLGGLTRTEMINEDNTINNSNEVTNKKINRKDFVKIKISFFSSRKI